MVAMGGDFLMAMDIWDATALLFIDNESGSLCAFRSMPGNMRGIS